MDKHNWDLIAANGAQMLILEINKALSYHNYNWNELWT